MDHCIESILECAKYGSIEILIVDDGSTKDDTPRKADEWQEREPDIIHAIHQPNKGHGGAVNTGLSNARGLYFKVVDSDDWLDVDQVSGMMAKLGEFSRMAEPVDLLICNYIYDHVYEGKHVSMDYRHELEPGRILTWDETGNFKPSRYLLMHSVYYRTQVLRDTGLVLPEHTFYVDNIFVYVPLPKVRTLYYHDADLYHYFLGRDDQSVNEKVIISRIDQQLTVTRFMIDAVRIPQDIRSRKLERYMVRYLTMMMIICTVFSLLSDRPDRLELREGIWDYLKARDENLYNRIRTSAFGRVMNLKGPAGEAEILHLYHLMQRIYGFN